MQSSSNLIILLQSRTTTQNLRQPELTNGALHMTDLPLGGGGGSNPLRRFTTNTTDHIGMGESLGGALGGLHSLRLNGLGDARVQRRGATGDHQRVLSVTNRSRRTSGKRVKRGAHGDGFFFLFFSFLFLLLVAVQGSGMCMFRTLEWWCRYHRERMSDSKERQDNRIQGEGQSKE